VHLTAELDAPCAPVELFAWVDDLSRYPQWLTIVERAERQEGTGVWEVDLRGRIGPLARSKRLRMARTFLDDDRHVVRFERQEGDGRHHSAWELDARVTATATGSLLEMELHYGGPLWGPVIERLLLDEIEQARPRLRSLVAPPA
jgi:hypothetical protein